MINLIEYGMNTVGRNLKLIRQNDIEGLKRVIIERSERIFGPVTGYLDDQALEIILRNAALELEGSIIFEWRIKDAREIYNYLGDSKKVKVLDKKIKEYENIPVEDYNLFDNNMFDNNPMI